MRAPSPAAALSTGMTTAVIGAFAFTALAGAAQAATVQKILVSGDPAPGIPGAVISPDILSYLELFPTIDDAGNVAFLARIEGDGIDDTNDTAIWSGSPASPALVARSGSQAPGEAAGVTFRGFPEFFTEVSPTIGAGRVAILGSVDGPGITTAQDVGVWTGTSSLERVAREGTGVPAHPGMTFSSMQGARATPGGELILTTKVVGTGVTTENDEGFWIDRAGALESLLREGDAAPGEAPGVVIGGAGQFIGTGYNFLQTQVSAGGFTTLSTVTGPGIDSYSNEVLVAVRDGQTEIVAREGQAAAGMGPNVVYGTGVRAGFSALSIDALGHEAFLVRLGGGEHAYETVMFSSHVDGTLRPVVFPFDEAPGTSGDAFAILGYPVLNAAGYVAFNSSLASDTGSYPPFGLWWDRPGPRGSWTPLVVPGQSLPGAPEVTIVSAGSIYGFAASGHIAFRATLQDPELGFRTAILGATPDGALDVLLQTGASLDVHGDGSELREVESFVVGAVNSEGAVAVRADFTDGSFGYYTITPGALVAVGEPTAGDVGHLAVLGRNPFRAETRVAFTLDTPAMTRLDVFDVAGRRVAALLEGVRAAGTHEVRWDGRDRRGVSVAPGVYWARLGLGNAVESVRLVRIDTGH